MDAAVAASVPRLMRLVASIGDAIGAPCLCQAWLPRSGLQSVLMTGPSKLLSFGSAPHYAVFGALLSVNLRQGSLSDASSLPVTAYNNKAPAWTPSMSDDAHRMNERWECPGIHAAVALPVFSLTGECNPVAVLEVVFCERRLCFGDLIHSMAGAMAACGDDLRFSVNRSMCFHPPATNNDVRTALAQLGILCQRLALQFGLPLVQLWLPCIIPDDTRSEDEQSRPSAAILLCRGMPFSSTHAGAWAFHTACCERCLESAMGVPGAAWHLRGCVWTPHHGNIVDARNPMRPWTAMCGLQDCASLAFCVSPSGGSSDTYVVHALIPPQPNRGLASSAAAVVLAAAAQAAAVSCMVAQVSAEDVYRLGRANDGGDNATNPYSQQPLGPGVASPPGTHGRALPDGFFAPVEAVPDGAAMGPAVLRRQPPRAPEHDGLHGIGAEEGGAMQPPARAMTSSGRMLRAPRRYDDSPGVPHPARVDAHPARGPDMGGKEEPPLA